MGWHISCVEHPVCTVERVSMRLNETQIKRLVLEKLRSNKQISSKSILASEFVVAASGNRIDLAIWNGEFIGIEIKSEFDTLKRLGGQISAYIKCFDRVIVVLAERHLNDARPLIPNGVEIWKLASDGSISIVQSPIIPSELGKAELIRMLTLPQLRKIVGASTCDKHPRSELRMLAEEIPTNLLRDAVVSSFKASFGKTSSAFWNAIGRRKLAALDISFLSRTRTKRSEQKRAQSAAAEFWKNWITEAERTFNTAA